MFLTDMLFGQCFMPALACLGTHLSSDVFTLITDYHHVYL